MTDYLEVAREAYRRLGQTQSDTPRGPATTEPATATHTACEISEKSEKRVPAVVVTCSACGRPAPVRCWSSALAAWLAWCEDDGTCGHAEVVTDATR